MIGNLRNILGILRNTFRNLRNILGILRNILRILRNILGILRTSSKSSLVTFEISQKETKHFLIEDPVHTEA